MKKEKSWFFAKVGGGPEEGFKHLGMQYFTASPDHFVARETIQNSLDAKDTSKKGEPVVVKFKLFRSEVKDAIPELGDYQNILKECLAGSQKINSAKNFFKKALATTEKQKIDILQISDYATVGIKDINKDGGRWHNLIKKKGESEEEGYIGGTFGIGKSAPFTCSGLRTVFYNTKNIQKEKGFIWKSIFTLHGSNPKRHNEGYFCEHFEENNEIYSHGFKNSDLKIKPKFADRDQLGTDLFILDYKLQKIGEENQPWHVIFERVIMNNYFTSIYNNELKVEFIDERTGIHYGLSSTNIYKKMKDLYERSPNFCKSFPFLDAYVDTKSEVKEESIEGLGKCSLHIKIDINYPKHVAFIRRPKMLVKSDPNGQLNTGYAALFICDNNKGNKFLSTLEGPTHSEWKAGYAEDPAAASTVLIRLSRWINDHLRSLAERTFDSETILGDLDQLSYEDDTDIESPQGNEEVNPEEIDAEGFSLALVETPWDDIHYKKPKPSSKRRKTIAKGEHGFDAGDDDDQFGGGGQSDDPIDNPEPTPVPGSSLGVSPGGQEGKNVLKPVPKSQYRYKCFLPAASSSYKLVISTKNEKKCNIIFYAKGIESAKNESIDLKNAADIDSGEKFTVGNNIIYNVETTPDPKSISVEFASDRRYTVELELLA